MLFATQNPPGAYGGRKVLSKAFRNRFVEVHVGDIPDDELAAILQHRCGVRAPASLSGALRVAEGAARWFGGRRLLGRLPPLPRAKDTESTKRAEGGA